MVNSNIPGWKMSVNERNKGEMILIVTNNFGVKAEFIEDGCDETHDQARDYAFHVERQISKHLNKFLFHFCLLNLRDENILAREYLEVSFGSWLVEVRNKRFVYEGKDSFLLLQIMEMGEWSDKKAIRSADLTYSNYFSLLKS